MNMNANIDMNVMNINIDINVNKNMNMATTTFFFFCLNYFGKLCLFFCYLFNFVNTEALFGDEEHTEYEEIDDIDDAFRMQCKQIFIGMVTMQYQAKTDMVRRNCNR